MTYLEHAASRSRLQWSQGDKGAIPGEPFRELGDEADLIECDEPGGEGKWYVRLHNGDLVQNPRSDVPGGSALFDTADEAMAEAEKIVLNS